MTPGIICIYIYIIHTKSAIKVCHVSWVSPCGPLPAGVSYHSKSPLSHPLGEYVLLFPSILSRKNVWNIPLAKLEDFHYAGQLSKTWRWGRGLTRISMFLHFFGSWTCLNQIYTYIYILDTHRYPAYLSSDQNYAYLLYNLRIKTRPVIQGSYQRPLWASLWNVVYEGVESRPTWRNWLMDVFSFHFYSPRAEKERRCPNLLILGSKC